jgi:hypothetical protein
VKKLNEQIGKRMEWGEFNGLTHWEAVEVARIRRSPSPRGQGRSFGTCGSWVNRIWH